VPSNSAPEPGPNRALWILRVHHHAGSLETIVAKGRRTNDVLSAGLLLLIFATIYALVRFSRRAQNLAELQMNFVSGVSHELRTPLTVIRTAAYNLRGELATQPGQVARYGALIRAEAEKLSALVEQVLRYGNARAGRVLQKREPLAVEELIEAGLLAARNATHVKDVTVEKHIEPDLPLILADRESMQHALQNLFENAMKYGAPGGDWIGISATPSKNGGPSAVEIRVTDRGPGDLIVINRDTWYGTVQKLNGALQLTGCDLVWRMTVTKYILLVDDSELIRSATRHFLESQRVQGVW
jgi:signal transduction histidine kinase